MLNYITCVTTTESIPEIFIENSSHQKDQESPTYRKFGTTTLKG